MIANCIALKNLERYSTILLINRFNSSKRKINGYNIKPKIINVIPKPKDETRYTIMNNNMIINNQNRNALEANVECFLNGLI